MRSCSRRWQQTIPLYLTTCFFSARLRHHLYTLLATPPTSITSVASFKHHPPPTTSVMALLIRRRLHPTARLQLARCGFLVLDGHRLLHLHHLHLQLSLPILFTKSKFCLFVCLLFLFKDFPQPYLGVIDLLTPPCFEVECVDASDCVFCFLVEFCV